MTGVSNFWVTLVLLSDPSCESDHLTSEGVWATGIQSITSQKPQPSGVSEVRVGGIIPLLSSFLSWKFVRKELRPTHNSLSGILPHFNSVGISSGVNKLR